MKKYLRKIKHLRYIDRMICDMRWEIINIITVASATEFTDATQSKLMNLGLLVRKLERRRKLLRF